MVGASGISEASSSLPSSALGLASEKRRQISNSSIGMTYLKKVRTSATPNSSE